MLEDHQRAALMPNTANLTWAHFVRARFVAEDRKTAFAVEILEVALQSPIDATVKGMLEQGARGSLPVVYEFLGTLDLESRELTIRDQADAQSYAGRFSENGRVLTLELTTGGRGTGRPMHLIHEGTRQELFGE
jgi:hypothetical protein